MVIHNADEEAGVSLGVNLSLRSALRDPLVKRLYLQQARTELQAGVVPAAFVVRPVRTEKADKHLPANPMRS